MNWKEEAVQRLSDYRLMRNSVNSIRREIKRLEMEAVSMGSPAMNKLRPVSGSSQADDRMLNNLVRRQELADSMEQAELWVSATDQALSCLDPQEKLLLDRMFIRADWGNVTDIAQELGLERSTVYRRKDEALRKFTIALYGKS